MKSLKATDILEALESKLAYVPGGRNRDGRPLIVISVPPELDPTTKPKLESLILYFLSIFRYALRITDNLANFVRFDNNQMIMIVDNNPIAGWIHANNDSMFIGARSARRRRRTAWCWL